MSVQPLRLSTKNRSRITLWVVALAVVLIMGVLEFAGLLGWLRASVELVIRPFSETGVRIVRAVSLPAEFVRIATRRYTYVLDLELRYAESAAKLSELDRLQKENQALRELIEGEQASASGRIPRRIVASVLSYAQPTIAAGTADGLKEGSLVFVKGTLIGKVMQASEHQSQIRLLPSFSDNEVVLAQTDSGVSGLLSGWGSEVVLKEVPIDAQLQVGQRVETSGQLGFQSYLYVGRIREIQRNESSPTQTAVIDQGASFYRASVVEVLP